VDGSLPPAACGACGGAGRGTAAFTAEGGMGYNGAVAFGGRCALPERG